MLTDIRVNPSCSQEEIGRPVMGLVPHPLEFDCHYTAIKLLPSQAYMPPNQCFDGYNFYSSRGIEACNNTIACCLTAYNEPLSEYLTSLHSLAACAEYFRVKGEERVSRELIICIIVDGIEKMSKEFAAWSMKLGIYQAHALDDEADFHMFESLVPREKLLGEKKKICGNDASQQAPLQRIILFIKTENRGKLDSHQCFFDRICGHYSAKYFVQIDVGTAPHEDALYHMWAELQMKPKVAATAARSLLPWPDNKFDLLKLWQYSDIAVERIINWPSEIFLGNLSVLPGQLSLTRIDSVLETVGKAPDDDGISVLDRYYRGLSQLGPFESNMYLAEDRILGQEMVFQKNSTWELSYETDAEAVVDACETWSELCRQRRRWICSSMACRFALLGKLPKIFNNKNRDTHERLHKVLATIYFTLYSFLEWIVPAVYLLLQTAMMNIALSQTNSSVLEWVVRATGPVLVACVVLQSFVAWQGQQGRANDKLIAWSLYFQTLILVGNTAIVLISGNHAALTVLLISSVSVYLGIAACYSRELALKIGMVIIQYMFARLPVKAYLMTYSIFNVHDTSWGTKGLNTSRHAVGTESVRKSYRQFRIFVISIFTLTNAGIYLLAYSNNMLSQVSVIYIMYAVLFSQLTIAVLAQIASKLKFKRKVK